MPVEPHMKSSGGTCNKLHPQTINLVLLVFYFFLFWALLFIVCLPVELSVPRQLCCTEGIKQNIERDQK